MGWNNPKFFPADTAYSRYIRLKRGKCDRCGRLGYGDEGIFGLEASHFYSRGKWSVRFDDENVDVLCKSDHKKAHQKPEEFERWKIEQMGQPAFDRLTLRAHTRSNEGSSYWKKLTKKQAEELFK